ncbi:MAG: hydrogenase maturation protease [Sulfurovum sp.]
MKNIVIGVGNILFKDEGVGIFASHYLNENYVFDGNLEIIDGGTLGFKLMTYFKEYDNVIILDTVSIQDKVGQIYKIPSKELLGLGKYRKTAHEVEIVEMLEICSVFENHANVTIIGIIPKDIIKVEIGLTIDMEKCFDEFILTTINEIKNLNIDVNKTNNVKLSSIVENLVGSYNSSSIKTITKDLNEHI